MKPSDIPKASPSEVDEPTIEVLETLERCGLTIEQARKVLRANRLAERIDKAIEYFCGHCGGFLTQDTCRNCGALNRFTARKVLGIAEVPSNHVCDHGTHNPCADTPDHIQHPLRCPA